MKVVLVGAFGKLGSDILRKLVQNRHEVIAADLVIHELPDLSTGFTYRKVDITNKEELTGLCEGADVVITTVGLTSSSIKVTNYDIDYQGNLNLLEEALRANVKHFAYISVLKADGDASVPMLHAKYLMEEKIKESQIDYVIYRPTGYFYDIAKVFMPMIEAGKVTLLGKKPVHANVIDTSDLADFIVSHMLDHKKCFDIGGNETYSYEEIATMFFDAAGKPAVIKRAPIWLFSLLAWMAKSKKNGKEAVIRFSKWTLSNEMVASTKYGKLSFKEYIKSCYHK